MMKWIFIRFFTPLIWLLCASLNPAYSAALSPSEEAIALFDVQAAMQKDGVLDLKENIHFQARNNQIKHGFFRDLPRLWARPDGEVALLTYRVVGVTRDGIPEPWQVQWRLDTMRIVVGSENLVLPAGDYRYQIHYQVTNVFLHDYDSDVLIWNVTGDGWPFKINQIRFSLQLPEASGNPYQQIDFFTGGYGETYKNGRILPDGRIESREPVYREDFTVLYRWPHTLLSNAAEPQTANIFIHLFVPSLTSLTIWLPCLLMACAFLYLWWRRPRFTPCEIPVVEAIPPEYSPGMLRLEAKQVYDDKGFCGDVTNLIVKGYIALENMQDNERQQCLIRVHTGAKRNCDSLTEEEQLLSDLLFCKGDKLVLHGGRNKVLRKAFLQMQKYYQRRRKGAVYRPTAFLLCGGLAMLTTLLLANITSPGWASMSILHDFFISIFFVIPLLFSGLWLLGERDDGKPVSNSLSLTLLLPLVGGMLIFLLLWIKIRYWSFYWFVPAGYFSAWCLTSYITALGYIFLPNYTRHGQQRFAYAAGVMRYLEGQEAALREGRRRKGERRTLDISLLGWAVAAGLGKEWAAKLTPSLLAAIRAPEIASVSTLLCLQSHLSSGAYTSALGRGGGSGGGFSGGGAGGGGGGGW